MSDTPESAAAKTARERLEHTRRELLRHMTQAGEGHGRRSAGDEGQHAPSIDDEDLHADSAQDAAHDEGGLGATWQNIRQTASAWWESHPAHLALEVAEPVFDKYARAHPVRVLAISAATGAALVLVKPWRLISVTGLLVAAVKSTQMSALAAAMLRPRSSAAMQRHEAEQAREEERTVWRQAQDQARARDRLH